MCPAHEERDYPTSAGGMAGAAPRPGGGTYPVRPVASAPHPTNAPAERPVRPPPRPIAPYATTRTSPRGLLTVILIGIGLVTLVLLFLAVDGYLPDAGFDAESEAQPAPEPPAAPVN